MGHYVLSTIVTAIRLRTVRWGGIKTHRRWEHDALDLCRKGPVTCGDRAAAFSCKRGARTRGGKTGPRTAEDVKLVIPKGFRREKTGVSLGPPKR